MSEETEMCDEKTRNGEDKTKRTSNGEKTGGCGCSCEPKRCAPIAAIVLAAVAVPLVIRALKRSRRSNGSQAGGHAGAGCCA